MHLLTRLNLASKGSGAYLCKIGTKRRRTAAEMFSQAAEEEIKQDQHSQQQQERIEALEDELKATKEKVIITEHAADILGDLIDAGAARYEDNGTVTILAS